MKDLTKGQPIDDADPGADRLRCCCRTSWPTPEKATGVPDRDQGKGQAGQGVTETVR